MAIFRIPIVKVKIIYKPLIEKVGGNIINTTPVAEAIRNIPTAGTTSDVKKETIFNFGNEIEKEISEVISLRLSNGEGDRSNNVQISFLDKDFAIDTLLLNRAITAGGIQIPQNLLKSTIENDTEAPPGGIGGKPLELTGDYEIPPEGTTGEELASAIIKYCKSVGVNDNAHIAAILGNIEIETRMGQFTEEIGGSSTQYAPYFGRGLIQITWKNNYQRFGAYFGQDFVNNPNLVKQLKWAIPIAVGGMTGVRGCPTFTGLKLSNFGKGSSFDFVGARKTVNGTDKAQMVASESRKWLAKIPELGLIPDKASNRIENTYAPGSADSITQLKSASNPVTASVPEWAIQIQVAIGWSDTDDVIVSSFWYVSRQINTSVPPTTTITGRGIRFLLSKSKRSSFQNISLRQLIERIGNDYGVQIQIPTSSSLDNIAKQQQNSETDYQFLLRVAQSQGYTLQSKFDPPTLTLVPPKDALKIKVKSEWNCSFSSTESASENRLITELPPIETLIDGQAIGEGFNTTLEINYPTFEVLSLLPGTILTIEPGVIKNLPNDSSYCRDYKLKAVNIGWGGTLKVTLDLYIPVSLQSGEDKPPGDIESQTQTGTQGNQQTSGKGTNTSVFTIAKSFIDKTYEASQIEASVSFVRGILKQSNHPKANAVTATPIDGQATDANMPNSLSGEDLGLKINDVASLNNGDIVNFANTFGNFIKGSITAVAIATGNGKMIDRDNKTKKIVERDIQTTYPNKFSHGIRLTE